MNARFFHINNNKDSPALLRKFVVHALCWLIYITYELCTLYYLTGKLEPPKVYIVYYGVNIAFFYGVTTILQYTFDRRIPRYFIGFAGMAGLLILLLTVKGLLNPELHFRQNWLHIRRGEVLTFVMTALYRAGFFFLLAVFYWAPRHMLLFRAKADRAEKALLRQQINPHLLLNSLNFVYSRVMDTSEEAAQCIVLLSELLRYSMDYTAAEDKSLLLEELKQMQNLMEINRYRFGKRMQMNMEFTGDPGDRRIPPLILLTLLENVFKHGDLTDQDHPASVRVDMTNDGCLSFKSQNMKKSSLRSVIRSHQGLQNLRARLSFMYSKDQYALSVHDQENQFETYLMIKL
ncbi:hypothetical protein FPZ42_06990 [Mucilaginibacter achroorhodeus]|uniref:Signal transduction histidine kinase internal region domain-containing protein n=1 Tax=Mucilaginibacter achroorhodeus TaxID=2599294 RepID=A0A563U5Y9_9SPHI|nr:sensor histidine kinase [Mucilaginibacter achroorhodeus]TWR26776.1 hypothetical protein FPZ42_06990 [Mucilaginibacter achroorhodeus]